MNRLHSASTTQYSSSHRDKALSLMNGRGAILDTAREVSDLIRGSSISAAVIGGIAVVLHGYWRSTKDIDLLVVSEPGVLAELLQAHGFHHNPLRKEFVRDEIPVHFVLPDQVKSILRDTIVIEGILTVALPQLIEMKLRSGTTNLLHAQDLADVIGLIRSRRLSSEFARSIDKALRPAFRKLVRAIANE